MHMSINLLHTKKMSVNLRFVLLLPGKGGKQCCESRNSELVAEVSVGRPKDGQFMESDFVFSCVPQTIELTYITKAVGQLAHERMK